MQSLFISLISYHGQTSKLNFYITDAQIQVGGRKNTASNSIKTKISLPFEM